MRTDNRFPRPPRSEIESELKADTLDHPQSHGVWSIFLQCDDPSDVAHKFRSYRDSPHCNIPRETLRDMRDTLIASMRKSNRNSKSPRKERRKGVHYPNYTNHWDNSYRTGA